MLLIVPPSETKRASPEDGPPVELEALSFPKLRETRRRLVDALVATSASPDAFERLRVRHTMAREVVRNTFLLALPALPVLDLYTGPLHEGLDAAGLSDAAAERAERSVVVTSALWGALRPTDRIPTYRMVIHASLLGIDRIDHLWRAVLPDVLAEAATDGGIVVDLRSTYQAMGMAAGLADRTVTLRVDMGPRGNRIGDVIAKRVRGEAAHHLLESGADPSEPDALAATLAERWPVRLEEPERHGKPWTLTLSVEG